MKLSLLAIQEYLYRVYIIGKHQVKESVNVIFDDTKFPNIQTGDASEKLKFNNLSDPVSDDEDTQPEIVADTNDNDDGESGGNIDHNGESTNTGLESSRNVGNISRGDAEGSSGHTLQQNVFQGESSRSVPQVRSVWTRDHPFELIIGDLEAGVRSRSATQKECLYFVFLSKMEPKKIEEALTDPDWVVAMQEELNQFEHQKVWKLVPRPQNRKVIDKRWVFRNKLDE